MQMQEHQESDGHILERGKQKGMDARKINWMYIAIFLFYIVVSWGLSYVAEHVEIGVFWLYTLNELVYLIPLFGFVIGTKDRLKNLTSFRKVKISTLLMTVLFTYLCMPLTTVINAFTMFFVDNTVTANSGQMFQIPFPAAFFLIAVYAPVCEEVIFRGVTYEALKKDLNVFQAMCLSAVFFGLAHMNFNQAAYAMVLGVVLVLLREATGSLYATIVFHLVFNGHSVVMMYVEKWLNGNEVYTEVNEALNRQEYREIMLITISVFMVVAAVTTALAGCVLFWIAGNESRKEQVKNLFQMRHKGKGKVWRGSFLIVLVLYMGMMLFDVLYPA